ncbi:conserved exported hypothetical protein [Gammaproteobacteria bacterium]
MIFVLMLGLGLTGPSAWATPPKNTQAEVEYLLEFVGRSGCDFYRNGIWHDSKAAQAHLRDKYNYLLALNLINTAENFIERAATGSSFTGQPYQVSCHGGIKMTMTSNRWLHEELARFRKLPAKTKIESVEDEARSHGRMTVAVNP